MIVRDLRLDLDTPESALPGLAARRLALSPSDLAGWAIRRRSLDARKGRPLQRVYTVEVWRAGEERPPEASLLPPPKQVPTARREALPPPIVVGTGPAGLFAAWALVEAGLRPLLLERGRPVAARNLDVWKLRHEGHFAPESNVCFGEGGAGTYSDGKLYTRRNDPRIAQVIARFVAHGAPADLAVDAHPHIGSNRLARIIPHMRAALTQAGATYRFDARVDDLEIVDGRVRGLRLADGEVLESSAVVLACGHAARHLYERLHERGVAMAAKGFAVGFRVEHPQALVDHIQYGPHAGHPALPPADYRLARQARERGVYSFCMCPGGYIVPTPVEAEHLAVNGMSNSRRGSPHANSALVVELRASELEALAGRAGPLAGLALQRSLEQESFRRGGGGYQAPAQRLSDFLAGRAGDLPTGASYRPGLRAASLAGLLPAPIEEALREALVGFGRTMRGFVSREAVLVGTETMTSAPLTILRDEQRCESPSHPGLFPAGEGAGHAGGITSSALDGERVARALVASLFGP